MTLFAWLFGALFFALAGEPEAAPPRFNLEPAETVWAGAAADFDHMAPTGSLAAWRSPKAKQVSEPVERDYEPWSDRKDFALAALGVFGILMITWAGTASNPFVRTLGAAILVIGFLMMSGLA